MSRELHVLFPDENEYLVKVPTIDGRLTLPSGVLFHAVYVCDITDCPSFTILKDKRVGAKPGIPLPFIAAAETDIDTLKAYAFFAKPTGTMQFLKPRSNNIDTSFNDYFIRTDHKNTFTNGKELSNILREQYNLHKHNTSLENVL